MSRPSNLPDFGEPPLNELVLGLQFAPIPNYSSVDARDVWELFRTEFPVVQEQPLLPPQFETFGGGPSPAVQFQFGPMVGPMRLWFANQVGDHLLQFQPDRFLINWRQSGDGCYPRYEQISQSFHDCVQRLSDHILKSKKSGLDINQIEITYVNIISAEGSHDLRKWLKVAQEIDFSVETLSMHFTEIVSGDEGKPVARLHHDLQSVVSMDGQGNAFQLNLTYRGKPNGSGIEDAFDLLGKGRVAIVNRFTDMTTDIAHRAWKRSV